VKDYYAVLHVLPTADVAVIAAAYRALARKYHPDTANCAAAREGNPMAEINEAYEVLSDADKRKGYDKKRSEMGSRAEFSSAEERMGPGQAEDWKLACSLCPDAKQCFEYLSLLSPSLAFAYAAYLLDSKRFKESFVVARDFDAQFMKNYFGSESAAHSLARRLLLARETQAAKALNRAIRVMGDSLDLDPVRTQLLADFPLAKAKLSYLNLAYWIDLSTLSTNEIIKVLRELGVTGEAADWLGIKWKLTYGGSSHIVDTNDLCDWALRTLQSTDKFRDVYRGPQLWSQGQ
jgi:curved DNA-binding protein CbpA